ncbi:hypothetical protein D7147_04805 [Micromonospora musae]|uniref:Uncharacterized protein n=1 Tax=Micromonospora musae TaxID=1894970 RepID=A0ABX9REM7_9ACTN|nr:hypothetical protein [Micromonospora musae]RKN22060.1 hypothetical protein D7147_04805 [Micromonospora musae]
MNRQPIVNRAAIVSGVGAVVAVLAIFGLDVPEAVQEAVVGVLAIVAPFAVAYWSQRHTTPLPDPQDANGVAPGPGGSHWSGGRRRRRGG